MFSSALLFHSAQQLKELKHLKQLNKGLRTHVKNNRIKHVLRYLNGGADVDARNGEGETVLMRACDLGHIHIARLLIERGANLDARNYDQYDSPLINACQSGHIDVARLLLDSGANVDGLHSDNDNVDDALVVSSSSGNAEMVQLLLERGAVRASGLALKVAAEHGHAECVRLLLENGVYPDWRYRDDEKWRKTPLMEASEKGHVECVRVLLDFGAEVNANDGEHSRALVYASDKGHVDVVRLLLDRGAEIKSDDGRMCWAYWLSIYAAVRAANVDCVRLLLERGADTNTRCLTETRRDFVWDRSALMECFSEHRSVAPERYTEIMHLLLEYGAHIATVDDGQRRAVDVAAYPAATAEQLDAIAQCLRARAATTIQKNFRKHAVIKKMMDPNHEYGRALLLSRYRQLIDGE